MKPRKARKGAFFEAIVKLIQESYRDHTNTVITQNKRLINSSGRKREFDIVIEANVNNFPLIIVVECRDKAAPTTVSEVEAFITKCNRISTINKKIFVSKSGYQDDAINAAREAGIILFQLKDLDTNAVLSWLEPLGFKQIKTQPKIIQVSLKPRNKLDRFPSDYSLFVDNNVPVILEDLTKGFYYRNRKDIDSQAMDWYSKNKDQIKDGSPFGFEIRFDLSSHGIYILNEGKKEFIDGLHVQIEYTISVINLQPDTVKSFAEHNSPEDGVEVVSYPSALPNSRFTVIKDPKKKNHIQIMVTNNEGGPMHPKDLPSFMIPEGLDVKVDRQE